MAGNIALIQETITAKQLKLYVSCPSDTSVHADKQMIDTVIRNLMNNAVKFTPERGRISVFVNQSERCVNLSVEDTGVGIAPEKLSKLFNIDTIESTNGTANEKGSGLGLIVCHEFITINQCSINVESTVGVGSRFTISIPKKNTLE